MRPVVGVLALQGGFAAHAERLAAAGAEVREVRHTAELEGLRGLVLPGGESTTLFRLMADEPWPEALRRLHAAGGALFGTCAGAILLCREIRRPPRPGLGLLDAAAERNAYGRQVHSFEARLAVAGFEDEVTAPFIRAPRLCDLGPGVEVLAWYGRDPVLVRQGRVLAATFHPELTGSERIHRLFLTSAAEPPKEASGADLSRRPARPERAGDDLGLRPRVLVR